MKKRMKKMLALGLAVAMTCGVSMTAMAAEPTVAQTETVETDTQAVGQADATEVDEAETVTDTGEAVQASEETQDAAEQESVTADVQDVSEEASETEAGTVEAGEEASVATQAPQSLNGLVYAEDGNWYLFKNGVVDLYSGSTLVLYSGSWWYVKDGKLDFSYEGVCQYGGVDWYVKDGRVQFGYSGFVYTQASDNYRAPAWYYIHEGKIDKDYDDVVWTSYQGEYGWYHILYGGLDYHNFVASNANGWWYIGDDGKVDFSYEGIGHNNNGTWYIRNGQVDFSYNGIWNDVQTMYDGKVIYNQWYFKDGKVDDNMNGVYWTEVNGQWGWHGYYQGRLYHEGQRNDRKLFQNNMGWWALDENGQVDFAYEGIGHNEYGSWYLKNGQVDFTYNGYWLWEYYGEDTYYRIINGKLDENYTGIYWLNLNGKWDNYGFQDGVTAYCTVLQNEQGWWYVGDYGTVDFSYNRIGSNEYGNWKIRNGAVDFSYTGVLDQYDGHVYLRYIQNGYAGFQDDVVLIAIDGEYAWWKVTSGRIDKTYTGLACNSNGWWYLKDGKVDFSYTGIASNENGTWYVKNGQVDFGYTGIVQTEYDKVSYYAVNGLIVRGNQDIILGDNNGEIAWWAVKNGTITAVDEGIGSNENGLWYYKEGKVDFEANGTKVIRVVYYDTDFTYIVQVSSGYVTDVRVVNPEEAFGDYLAG